MLHESHVTHFQFSSRWSPIEAVELGAVAGLALIYPFYILCSTLEKEGTLKKYAPDQRRKGSQETVE